MRCVVLMSTYNGESYISEQLKSILLQLPEDGQVLIRDDGSSDGTVSVILGFDDSRITIFPEQNIGFARSFFEVMRRAPPDQDLYFLSDQDDVWLPGKVRQAWARIESAGHEPFLYCAVPRLVDACLNPIGVGRKASASVDLTGALTENQVTGCTVAMNWPLLSLAIPSEAATADVHFHDWWLYVLATAFGSVFCDEVPNTLYRQHGDNYIGYQPGVSRYLNMLAYLRRKNWLASMAAQMRAFRLDHGARLSTRQRAALEALYTPESGLRRWPMTLALHRHRPSWTGELLLRLLLLCDWREKG